MGIFSKKHEAGGHSGDGPMHFGVYALPEQGLSRFREAFDHQFGSSPQVTISIGRAPPDIADGYAISGPTDRYVTVAPRGQLDTADKSRVVQSVKAAAKEAGASSTVAVREKGGFDGVPLPGQ